MKPRLRSLLWGFMALTLLLAGTTLVCAYDISFSDVPESSWFYEDVMTLSESGVVSGYPDGTYRPTKKVTTGESLKMILLAAGYPEPERVDSHWARGYLNFAIDQGFLVRYQDISDLDVNMTRGKRPEDKRCFQVPFRTVLQYDARDARQACRKRARSV